MRVGRPARGAKGGRARKLSPVAKKSASKNGSPKQDDYYQRTILRPAGRLIDLIRADEKSLKSATG
jgi:hypothetical protein